MQAMILAAGFGTRLRPYTVIRPKPLFPLFNIELLRLVIDRLKAAGCHRILVNAHYLAEQIVDVVEGIDSVTIQLEEEILGTGGGLRKALDWMEDEPILVVNGDIYHGVDLSWLFAEHMKTDRRVTLAVHDYPRFNSIAVHDGRVVAFACKDRGALAFTGIHVVHPEVLEAIPKDEKSCIIERYRQLVRDDAHAIGAIRVDGSFWTDMGTKADYLALQGGLLQQKIPCWPALQEKTASPFFVEDGAMCPDDTVFDGWASVGRAVIGNNVTVRRSIIWDGAVIADNAVVEDQIVV